MTLPAMPADKANHFAYGAAAAAVGFVWNPIVAFCLVMAVGIGKELHDKLTGRGDPSTADAAFTLLGGLVVAFPWLWRM